MSKQGLISICSLVLVATGTLWADHIIYDEFDDGDLATNTNGIGNGFVGAGSKGTTAWTETDGQTLIHATNNGNRDRVNSIDTFDTTAGLTATWVISDIARGDDNGNAGRMLVGLVDAAGEPSGSPKANNATVDGFWISLNYDEGPNSDHGIGELIYVDEGVIMSLAAWQWDLTGVNVTSGADTPWDVDDAEGSRADRVGLTFNYAVAIILKVGAESYDLQFDAAGKPVPTVALSGALSGALPGNDITNAVATAYCQGPNIGGTPTTLGIDLIAVGDPVIAADRAISPSPGNGAEDVLRDGTTLSWTPGINATTHHLYWGDNFEDVNSATAAATAILDVNSFNPGRLEFDKTYFWRVDEVDDTDPDSPWKGNVWSFEVEPHSVKLPVGTVSVTASSTNNETTDPYRTIDGSGLDGDMHSNEVLDVMWMSASGDLSPSLTYEFDDVQKLDTLLIWNSNHSTEEVIGWGIKEVDIQVSTDGVEWTSLPDVGPIAQNSGLAPSEAQTVDMGSALAKYVRLNILSNHGGIVEQYAVAEVQFYAIPTQARTPIPEPGSADVAVDTVLSWRAGREADQHVVYLGTEANALADGSAPSSTSGTNSLASDTFDLQLDQTYHWRVDEVNDVMDPSTWAGEAWSFTTVSTIVVDDFESYGNKSPNRPFQTWLDGFGYSQDDHFPVAYEGNGTGSGVGHDIWSVASPHFNGKIMETGIASDSGKQSMPLYFSNTDELVSQTDRAFSQPQDWTQAGIKTLSVHFYGDPNNTPGELYVKINGSKVSYADDNTAITTAAWTPWNIDLSSVGTDLSSVNTLSIGVEGSGSTGLIYVDDIVLSRKPPLGETTVMPDPDQGN